MRRNNSTFALFESNRSLSLGFLALFWLAVICLFMGMAQSWLSEIWMACCRVAQMLESLLKTPFFIFGARGVVLFVGLIGFSTLLQRLRRRQHFVEEMKVIGKAGTKLSAESRLQKICGQLGVAQSVIVLKTPVPLAFCFGLWSPRICLSEGLVELLTDDELCAVLLHEEYHRRYYHPLRLLLADALAILFFFLPVLAEWRDRLRAATEIAADRYAERLVGRFSLASALHKLLIHPSAMALPAQMSGISGFSANATRIAILLGDTPPVLHLSKQALLRSSINLLLVCIALQLALLPLLFCYIQQGNR